MNNFDASWLPYLQNPLLLAVVGLVVLVQLVKPLLLNSRKISSLKTVPLVNKALNFIFILVALAILAGAALSWKNGPAGTVNTLSSLDKKVQEPAAASSEKNSKRQQNMVPAQTVHQSVTGSHSSATNVNGGGDVNITTK